MQHSSCRAERGFLLLVCHAAGGPFFSRGRQRNARLPCLPIDNIINTLWMCCPPAPTPGVHRRVYPAQQQDPEGPQDHGTRRHWLGRRVLRSRLLYLPRQTASYSLRSRPHGEAVAHWAAKGVILEGWASGNSAPVFFMFLGTQHATHYGHDHAVRLMRIGQLRG